MGTKSKKNRVDMKFIYMLVRCVVCSVYWVYVEAVDDIYRRDKREKDIKITLWEEKKTNKLIRMEFGNVWPQCPDL